MRPADQGGDRVHRPAGELDCLPGDITGRVVHTAGRAERAHLCVHHPAADADGRDAAARRELEQEQPDPAAPAEDQHGAARVQGEPVEHDRRGPRGEWRRGRVGGRRAGRDRRDQVSGDDGELGVSARAVGKVRHRHHPVAGHQPAHAGPEAVHHPGDVVAEHARRGQPGPSSVRAVAGVHRVDPGRADRDPDLSGPRHRVVGLGQPQPVGAAELAEDHCLHLRTPSYCDWSGIDPVWRGRGIFP